jgi:hypothetical protein
MFTAGLSYICLNCFASCSFFWIWSWLAVARRIALQQTQN